MPLTSTIPVLTIPGLGGSNSLHWQSKWEDRYDTCSRVPGIDWNIPDKDLWLDALDTAIQGCSKPPLVAAHSLGCALLAHWAWSRNSVSIKGAIFVAPGDVNNRATLPSEALCFAPMPLLPMPFLSMVIASENDPYVTVDIAQKFATAWGSRFLNIGKKSHINADSNLADWDQGWDQLHSLPQISVENRPPAKGSKSNIMKFP